MSVRVEHEPNGSPHRRAYCSECGEYLASGRFCPACGHPRSRDAKAEDGAPVAARKQESAAPAVEQTAPTQSEQRAEGEIAGPAAKQPPRRRLLIGLVVAGALLSLVGAVSIAVLLLSGSDSGSAPPRGTVVYRQKLAAAISPLVATNTKLSDVLKAMSGKDQRDAKLALTDAQSALTGARGAIAVLTVPPASALLSQQTEQALMHENGYLQAVGATLSSPTAANAAELQPLAASTASALVPLDDVVPGAHASVYGADNLASWAISAERAATAARQRAQQRQLQQAARSGAQQGSQGSGSTTTVVTPVRPPVVTSGTAGATYPLVSGLSGTINVRNGPSMGDAVVGSLTANAVVTVVCQEYGGVAVNNGRTSTLWDRIASPSGYVSDMFVATPGWIGPSC